MVVGGKVEVRPIMNIALTYDHRLIDGREVRGLVGGGAVRCRQGQGAREGARTAGERPAVHFGESSGVWHAQLAGLGASQGLRQRGAPCTCAGTALPLFVSFLLTVMVMPVAVRAQAVTFLKRVKEIVEDPRRLLLDV